jgi:hypothetical protein
MRYAIFLFVCLLAAVPSRADGGDIVDVYNVSGTLTITGTNACSPVCTETLTFSFEIGSYVNPYPDEYDSAYQAYVIPNSGTVEASGPLGDYTMDAGGFLGTVADGGGACGAGGDCNRIEFNNADGDEIDLHLALAGDSVPIIPNVNAADLFHCGSTIDQTCATDMFSSDPSQSPYFNFGTVETTVTPVPEPSSLLMLGAGLGTFGLMALWRRRYSSVLLS